MCCFFSGMFNIFSFLVVFRRHCWMLSSSFFTLWKLLKLSCKHLYTLFYTHLCLLLNEQKQIEVSRVPVSTVFIQFWGHKRESLNYSYLIPGICIAWPVTFNSLFLYQKCSFAFLRDWAIKFWVGKWFKLFVQEEVSPNIQGDPIRCLGKWYDSVR